MDGERTVRLFGMVSVLTAGHVNWDVTLRIDRLPEPDGEAAIRSQTQSGGGSAANVATSLAALSIDCALIGSVGDDDNGHLARRELERSGVDVSAVRTVSGETTVKYLLVDDDGAVSVLGNDGVNEATKPADVDPNLVREVDHVHLTGQRPDTAAHIAGIANEASVPVSFDPGRRLADRDYSDALGLTDLLFVNDRESDVIADGAGVGVGVGVGCDDDGRWTPDDCVHIVTDGNDGATVHAGGEPIHHPGFEIEPVDTTGAGDAFAAGFIAASLRGKTDDYERALEFGNACGALASCRDGARSTPSETTVEQFLDERG